MKIQGLHRGPHTTIKHGAIPLGQIAQYFIDGQTTMQATATQQTMNQQVHLSALQMDQQM